jgi:uncharacterized membrane protein YeaQ/YmgE (transglycosylase-associated protein family)
MQQFESRVTLWAVQGKEKEGRLADLFVVEPWNIFTRYLPQSIEKGKVMEDAGIGWVAAIIIGGIAGWLAEKFMKSNMGVFMNIILGIVGAVIANAILGIFGIVLGGWIGYLIAGFIGACILIAVARVIRR